ncbi:MAG TPA: hypothetical protein VHE61_13335 [Opitutaceae bacterium]|nr:hypothetical protein [Opitutaceae bacterium]
MRRILLLGTVLAIAAGLWWRELIITRGLEAQWRSAGAANAELAAARAEQARLQHALPSEADLRTLHAAASDAQRLREEQAKRAEHPGLSASAVGEWSPVASWRDRGSASPRAALETALWAASGGDTGRLAQLLELPDDVRVRATALLETLPASVREKYSTAEALIAAFTIKSIPIGPAQIVWAQDADPDNATLAVFVRNPAVPRPTFQAGSVVPPVEPLTVDAPPMTREQAVAAAIEAAKRRAAAKAAPDYVPPKPEPPHTTLAYLSLHRGTDGWRLEVPSSAIDKIAREITGP